MVLSAAQSASLQGCFSMSAAKRSSISVWWPSFWAGQRLGSCPAASSVTSPLPEKLTRPFVPCACCENESQQPGIWRHWLYILRPFS